MKSACYRKITRFKYQLTEDYEIDVEITGGKIDTRSYSLSPNGILIIKKYYAWDGPSGPTIDTRNFMRGSLVHDCLYQMLRREELKGYRDHADLLLKKICKEDGMSSFRAWYVHKSVSWWGEENARPGTAHTEEIICIPPLEEVVSEPS